MSAQSKPHRGEIFITPGFNRANHEQSRVTRRTKMGDRRLLVACAVMRQSGLKLIQPPRPCPKSQIFVFTMVSDSGHPSFNNTGNSNQNDGKEGKFMFVFCVIYSQLFFLFSHQHQGLSLCQTREEQRCDG